MKKLIIILFISALANSTAYSQLKLGVRGGASVNNIKLIRETYNPYIINYESGLGFHFGLTSQLQISKLFIQPDLLFSTVTHEVTIEDLTNNGPTEVGKQRFNKFDIPIMAGFKFDNNFKIGIGPVFSKVLNSKSDVFEKQKSNKATVGYQFAAGFDWDSFNIELRYEGNLSKYGSGVKIAGNTYDFDKRVSQVLLSLAFYL